MGRKKQVSDEDLLIAARGVFLDRGLKASTKEIARRAGISEAAIFQRYKTKEELFFATMVPPAAGLKNVLVWDPSQRPAREALQQLAVGLLDYFRKAAPVLVHLMSHPGFRFEEFAARHPENPMVTLRSDLMRIFQLLEERGEIRPGSPSSASLILFGVLYSIANFELLGAHGGTFPASLVEAVLETLWEGMANREAATARKSAPHP